MQGCRENSIAATGRIVAEIYATSSAVLEQLQLVEPSTAGWDEGEKNDPFFCCLSLLLLFLLSAFVVLPFTSTLSTAILEGTWQLKVLCSL